MDETTPPPPSPEPTPAGTPGGTGPAPGAPPFAPNVAAAICAAVPLVGGIVFLVLEKKNAFVRFWAAQSVLVGIALAAVWVLFQVMGFVFSYIPFLGKLLLFVLMLVSLALWLGWLCLWIIMVLKAYSREEWEIPVLGKLARRHLAGQKPL